MADFNRTADIGEYLNGNDILIGTLTAGEGDTDTNMINRLIGLTESYDGSDNYGIANAFGAGGDPNSNSFVAGLIERMGGDSSFLGEAGVPLPGADDPMNPQDFCNLDADGCR